MLCSVLSAANVHPSANGSLLLSKPLIIYHIWSAPGAHPDGERRRMAYWCIYISLCLRPRTLVIEFTEGNPHVPLFSNMFGTTRWILLYSIYRHLHLIFLPSFYQSNLILCIFLFLLNPPRRKVASAKPSRLSCSFLPFRDACLKLHIKGTTTSRGVHDSRDFLIYGHIFLPAVRAQKKKRWRLANDHLQLFKSRSSITSVFLRVSLVVKRRISRASTTHLFVVLLQPVCIFSSGDILPNCFPIRRLLSTIDLHFC